MDETESLNRLGWKRHLRLFPKGYVETKPWNQKYFQAHKAYKTESIFKHIYMQVIKPLELSP